MVRKLSVFILIVIMAGCSNSQSNEKPPIASLEVDDDRYETTLGSYCWGRTCADAERSPRELLKGKKPVKIKSGETVSLDIDYKTKPNDFNLNQHMDEKQTAVKLQNDHFITPEKPGIYYYTYSVWWLDDKKENVSNGSAIYAFALEVY
ncbi:hypothetical protein CN378_04880 [Bacillus sp. AFS015802]|uniref:hypothetical protein n=1 Tax=Bacillus sp. AFS015802 TaxID=2033486 RepID=UPI000BFAFCDC|nr:hypothetical protein [Bacillus sp. AFS015802]PFA69212.1 hypothetical protein CN378_04880 [Bacillus sp. AFS015802]